MAKAKTKKPKRKPSAYNKHIGREMRAGKTMKQAAASWKRKGSTKSSPKKIGKSNPKGGKRAMAKGGFNTNKIYGAMRKIAIFVPAASIAMMPIPMVEKLKIGQSWYFGWNPYTNKFEPENLWKGWGPAMGAQVVTRIPALINKLLGMFR